MPPRPPPRHSRVRSGCRTCKIRRVKCDEQRPSCRKCVSSGRACDGYGIWGPPQVAAHPVHSLRYPPTALPDLAQDEKRCVDRFRNLLTSKLAQPFGSHFWSSLVHQLSLAEPAVLHASIALTSAHEGFVQGHGPLDPSILAPSAPFVLHQYNRAIRALTSRAPRETPGSLRVAVVSCVLFICLEMLRGDLNAMHAHFDSGVKLLLQLQHRDKGRLPPATHAVLVKHDPEFFDDHLVDVFARLNLQFLLLGHVSQKRETFVSSFQYGHQIHLPRYFSSVRQLRQSLSPILLAGLHMMKEIDRMTLTTDILPPSPSVAMLEKQRALRAATSDWITGYDNSIDSHLASIPPHERLGLSMLRLYADVSTILLATCFSIKETAYDPYLSLFESIIQRYRQFHDSYHPYSISNCEAHPFFTIDTCVFPPLYLTALKCRNRSTRREAIALLRRYQHMEGPWMGETVARVAEHVVDLEEEHFEEALQPPAGDCDRTAQPPPSTKPSVVLPEFSRIHCVECELPNRRDKDSNIGTLTLKRFRHELGKAGGWCINTCTLDLLCYLDDNNAAILKLAIDVTQPSSVDAAFKAAAAQFGDSYYIDVVVNNAGYSLSGDTESVTEQEMRDEFEPTSSALCASPSRQSR
ncbi:hypothetical protein BJX76DRAFT_364704 [Aspergillus varians]